DRDLAVCLHRAERLASGARLTECLAELATAFGVPARVLPMTDDRVRTRVCARGEWRSLQEFLIRDRGAGPVEDMVLDGVAAAEPISAPTGCRCSRSTCSWPTRPAGAAWPRPPSASPRRCGDRRSLTSDPLTTVAVLPVKRFDRAKQRLSSGLAGASREVLAE